MKLFKIAALDKDAELGKIRTDIKKAKGALWQAMKRDPALTDQQYTEIAEAIADDISKRIPIDVEAHFAGQCANFLAKIAYSEISTQDLSVYVKTVPSSDTINIILDSAFSPNPNETQRLFETFYKNKRYATRAGYSADLPSYKTLSSFHDAVAGIVNWVSRNIKDDKLWEKQVTEKKDVALDTTVRIHGEMDEPPRKGKGIDADDLINGKLDRSEWTVVIPKSKDAACYWGSGTEWCTAHPDADHNYYDHYSETGDLIIFINSRTGNRYQFHFNSNSFMNSADEELSSSVLRDELFNFAESFKDKLADFKPNKKSLKESNEEFIHNLRPLYVNRDEAGYIDSVADQPSVISKNEIYWHKNGQPIKSIILSAASGSLRYSIFKPNGEIYLFSNGTFSNSKGGKQMRINNPISTFQEDIPALVNEKEIQFSNGVREGRKNGFAQLQRESAPWSYFRDGKPISYNEMVNLFNTEEEIEEAGIQEYYELFGKYEPIIDAKLAEAKVLFDKWQKWNAENSNTVLAYSQLKHNFDKIATFNFNEVLNVANYADAVNDLEFANLLDQYLLE